MLGKEMAGWNIGTPTIMIWGNYNTVKNVWGKPESRIKAYLYNEKRIPVCNFTTENAIEDALRIIENSKAYFMYGYTNTLYSLALQLKDKVETNNKRFKGVFTTAESLNDQSRFIIEDVFGPVFDEYGCGEITSIAFQCKRTHYHHVIEPNVIVEFEDIGLGKEKAILLTDLTNYAMPLIRYRIGDIGEEISINTCDCGCIWQPLGKITGRMNDILITPKGGKLFVPSSFLSLLMKDGPGIAKYQLAQIKDDQLVLRVVLSKQSKINVDYIKSFVDPYLEGLFCYSIEIVDDISTGLTGKTKMVVDERKSS